MPKKNPDSEEYFYDADATLRQMKSAPENFPKTWAVLYRWASRLQAEWVNMAKEFKPGWWGAQYLGFNGSNIKIRITDSLTIEIYHDNSGSKYDFQKVVHEGRSEYDLKRMLQTSEKVRFRKKDGRRYLIIPMPTGKGGKKGASFIMTKVGENPEISAVSGRRIIRNIYSYQRLQRGNTTAFPQTDRAGRTSYRQAKLVTMTEGQAGWRYPAFDGVNYQKIIEEMRDKSKDRITLELTEAMREDISAYMTAQAKK